MSKNLLKNVSGWFDFDDLLDRVDRLEVEQWLSDELNEESF